MTKPSKWDVSPAKTGQPGHPPSLIRVLAVRMKKAWVLSCPLCAQRRRSDWADAQAELSLRWVHTHFVGFVMRRLNLRCLNFQDFYGICTQSLGSGTVFSSQTVTSVLLSSKGMFYAYQCPLSMSCCFTKLLLPIFESTNFFLSVCTNFWKSLTYKWKFNVQDYFWILQDGKIARYMGKGSCYFPD